MSRMFYVVIMNLQSDSKGLGYILFVVSQLWLFFVLPLFVLEKLFVSVRQLQLRDGAAFLIVAGGLILFDWFYYFREKAQQRIAMKYRYEFVLRRPISSFFLFVFLPCLVIMFIGQMIYQYL